jgi:hypothetical protein
MQDQTTPSATVSGTPTDAATPASEVPAATVADTPTSEPAGVPDGTILEVRHADGSFAQEIIVNELDENGNVVGFHKEVHNG